MKPKILVLDDEEDALFGIQEFLSHKGYDVDVAATLAEAREAMSIRRYDAALVDLKLPDGNGQDLITEARESFPDMGIIVVSGHQEVPDVVEAMRRGADNFLTKPISMADLDVFIRKTIDLGTMRRGHQAYERLAKKDEPYFGRSPAMIEVVRMASIAARNETAIVIQGATGTGKGVLAQWLHDQSPRRLMPFVEVNCSSLKGDMLASELFGHVKGAFTSAVKDRQGLIDLADRGTLFLDEIGEMDMGVQAQFLKVIEEKRYRRMGEVKQRTSDFRLICATSRDLEEEARKGEFRQDLFFRIHVFPILMPLLRDIPEDIPGMTRHLLSLFGLPDAEISLEVMNLLNTYPWPGNVRELRNILERALLLADGAPLAPVHFLGLQQGVRSADPSNVNSWNLRMHSQALVAKALDQFGGNKQKAAEALGITPRTLYRWLSKS
ncbi:MAG: sigma-54 dependent transcriptional regulator [Planctomycetota bacterium]